MTQLYLYDDAVARSFEPFALTRPFGEMRAGIALGRTRWERALDARAAGFIGAEHLRDFDEAGAPPAAGDVRADSILANSRCLVPLGWSAHDADVWTCEGAIAAVRLAHGASVAELEGGARALESLRAAGTRVVDIPGTWVEHVWELVTRLGVQLREDIDALGPHLACTRPDGALVIGGGGVYVEDGAQVESQVVFDVTSGPVLVRRGAQVRAFTRLVGPCAVLENASVLGDRVSGCSIGEGSVVRGEISETDFLEKLTVQLEPLLGHPPEMHRFKEIYFEALQPNPEMIALMRELKAAGYRMAMLTNNVREWEPLWRSMLPVDEIFEAVVDSGFVGCRKPESKIYELTLERVGAPAEACLFVDDVEVNCEGARRAGMTAVHFRSNAQAIGEIRAALG